MNGKRKGETSYKETAFGVIPRSKLIPLEIEGIKKAWNFVLKCESKQKILFTPTFLKELHYVGFNVPEDIENDLEAWCDECEKVLAAAGGWTDEVAESADLRPCCVGCFVSIKTRMGF